MARFHEISGTAQTDRVGDVIFVHGLDVTRLRHGIPRMTQRRSGLSGWGKTCRRPASGPLTTTPMLSHGEAQPCPSLIELPTYLP